MHAKNLIEKWWRLYHEESIKTESSEEQRNMKFEIFLSPKLEFDLRGYALNHSGLGCDGDFKMPLHGHPMFGMNVNIVINRGDDYCDIFRVK